MSKKDKKMIICFFTIWTILMIIFGIVIILYLQSEYNNRLYNTTARIISKIHNEVPEKEAEIINKIYSNEDSKKEINSGKEILNKYGITKSTSTWGDTGMDFSYKVIIGISILFLLSVVSIYFAFLIYYRKQKTKWENLNTYCQNILNGIETINLTDEEEGIESIVKNDIYDVTMLLKQANKELTVTNKKTEKLIADISHQLKTPLTSLNMINDLLYEDMPEEKRKEFLDNMHFELEKIYWLINTLLNMAKLDSKTIILKKTPENLYTLLNEVRKEFCIMCETEEVEIEIMPHYDGRDLLDRYIAPMGIAAIIVLIYMAIRYFKLGVIKVIVRTISWSIIIELLYISIISLARIPVSFYTIPLGIVIEILTLTVLANKLEKELKEKKLNKKVAEQEKAEENEK